MRLFLAIELPDTIKDELITIQSHLKNLNLFEATYVSRENLHITLLFLGYGDLSYLGEITQKIDSLQYQTFTLHLQVLEVPNWSPPRLLWVTVPSFHVQELHQRCLPLLSYTPTKKTFTGHITLARIKQVHNKALLRKVLATTSIKPLSWNVTSIILMQSQTLQTGPVYTVLKRIDFT